MLLTYLALNRIIKILDVKNIFTFGNDKYWGF